MAKFCLNGSSPVPGPFLSLSLNGDFSHLYKIELISPWEGHTKKLAHFWTSSLGS